MYKRKTLRFGRVLLFDWVVRFGLGGEHNTTRATTLELDARTVEVHDELLDHGGLELELLCEMLHGDALTIGNASGESSRIETVLSLESVSESHGLLYFLWFEKFLYLLNWLRVFRFVPSR